MDHTIAEYETETNVQTHEVKFSWKINNYSLINLNFGQCLVSSVLKVASDKTCFWNVRLYPYGRVDDCNKYVAVFVACSCPKDKCIMVRYSYRLKDKDGKVLQQTQDSSPKEFKVGSDMWGNNKFIKRDELIPLLKDDILVVDGWIKWGTCVTDTCNKASVPVKPDFLANLSSDFRVLMEHATFSDVTLSAKDKTKFPAHKCVLAARSPVFAAMFKHDMKERRESTIKISDINADILKIMLDFIYTSKIDVENCEIEKLLAAADKYNIADLKTLCELELNKTLNIENAINLLLLADRHTAQTLKTQALKLISNNLKDVLKTDAMKNLTITQTSLFYEILEAVAN